MDTKIIGSKIATARKEKNMSQAQLAGLLFISPQAVGKWERGESVPDILTLNSLAEIFGVDLNYFSGNHPLSADDTANQLSNHESIAKTAPDATQPEQQLLTDFSASNLAKSDFAGVTAHKSKFEASVLLGADFSGADLTGSSFKASDAREANFDGANLTDCRFSILDMGGAQFSKTILVRTKFDKIGLAGAKFTNVTLNDVKLNMTDLRNTVFEKCTFLGTYIKYCDLRGMCLDGLTFMGVRFDKTSLGEATFRGATLKNVSFIPTFALTNKYYRAIKSICFDGAMMDKLTYAALKGIGADLSKVTIL